MKINNRRYIGCKTKLLEDIYSAVEYYNIPRDAVVTDLFAGTGVVGNMFAEKGYKTILNDTLYSNTVVYRALLGPGKIRMELMKKIIDKLNKKKIETIQSNYFSSVYGGKYFEAGDAKKIGYIRDYIEDNKEELTQREYDYLLSCLIYSCDKIANTVGHFESFLKTKPKRQNIEIKELDIVKTKYPSQIFNMDANILAKKIVSDVVYIDPPYNARQYVNFYHVLENLARWEKPTEFEGNSMKFKRNELKSDYCRNKAPFLFAELIKDLKCKLIVVSYNNTYTAGSISSVNTISAAELTGILKKKGKLKIQEINYKAFNSGKTSLKNHKEYLYICEVRK